MEGATKTQQIRSANVVSRDLADCSCQFPTMWWCLQAAVDMMRKVLNTVNMDGVIVIGEGEKDEVNLVTLSKVVTMRRVSSLHKAVCRHQCCTAGNRLAMGLLSLRLTLLWILLMERHL